MATLRAATINTANNFNLQSVTVPLKSKSLPSQKARLSSHESSVSSFSSLETVQNCMWLHKCKLF